MEPTLQDILMADFMSPFASRTPRENAAKAHIEMLEAKIAQLEGKLIELESATKRLHAKRSEAPE
jgi:ribosome-interacting GTPase 1